MCYWLSAIFGGQGGTLDNLQGSVISQVDLLNAVPEGVRLPIQPLDNDYYYLTLADWQKVFAEVFTRMPSYITDRRDCEVDPDLAYVMGLFFADGTCGLRHTIGMSKNNKLGGSNWNICNTNVSLLEKCIAPLENEYDGLKFKLQSYPSEGIGQQTNYGKRNCALSHLVVTTRDRHNNGDRGEFIKEWEGMFYLRCNGKTYKKVPPSILESSNISKKAFLEGVIDGDGHKIRTTRGEIAVYGEIGRSELIKLMLDINWGVSTREEKRKAGNFRIYYNSKTEDLTNQGGCDDFAWIFRGFVILVAGINAFGWVIGNIPAGRHGFNMFYTEDGWHILEPNAQYAYGNYNILSLGEKGYQPDVMVI